VAILTLAAVVLAVVSLVDALTDQDTHPVARSAADSEVRAGNVALAAPARPTRQVPTTAAATPTTTPTTPPANVKPVARGALPPDSGSGKRIVYDVSAQQVWLVEADDTVARTYVVSGSRYDQLDEGTYQVFSRSRHATSWHGTESMQFMVRFHRGARANIGFHDIPVNVLTGKRVQTLADLGTPLSDGCIRQDVVDAKALWAFAPEGTPVVVLR